MSAAVPRIQAFAEHDHVNVIVETPSGSRIKYVWDLERGVFEASKVLPLGMTFPFEFGFVPQTKASDGDPLDVLVVADAPLAIGCLVECRVLGAIEMKISETPEGELVRNDRVIVVPASTLRGAHWQELADLGTTLIDEIASFLADYVAREGRKVEILGQVDRAAAITLILRACR